MLTLTTISCAIFIIHNFSLYLTSGKRLQNKTLINIIYLLRGAFSSWSCVAYLINSLKIIILIFKMAMFKLSNVTSLESYRLGIIPIKCVYALCVSTVVSLSVAKL